MRFRKTRQTFGMTVTGNDGHQTGVSLTLPELQASLRRNRDSDDLLVPFTVAQAMRDIMDEQTFEVHLESCKITYEKD